ncbi:hypothetical protein M422DRAFT_36955 [Sphaerobolus stellatus SS14]|uniref:F-box domain-containing protein n=1 Tax=Sphaerobolus stellatus (strain SS14) TaxID=990650 RepID=A0A0C9U5C6_SPHS4|nr:hypothetical protein M422DRAFT_36955 [Sphaerobolus stellatus SS14]
MDTIKSLVSLSNELLESIVEYLDVPRDLHCLALTCRLLHNIIDPNHLQLRYIQCQPGREDLWSLLMQRPLLARNVRVLEIRYSLWGYRDGDIVPKAFLEFKPRNAVPQLERIQPPESSLSLIKALERMDNLVRFTWNGVYLEDAAMEAIFATLGRKGIQELSLYPRHARPISETVRTKIPCPMQTLLAVRSLSITKICHCHACYPHPFYDALIMTKNLPLTDLYLDFGWVWYGIAANSRIQNLFESAHWPSLKRFTLKSASLISNPSSDIMSNFLQRHSRIEALWLPPDLPPPTLEEGMLPCLRSLHFGSWKVNMEYRVPPSIANQLHHFSSPISNMTLSILDYMPSLKSCKVIGLGDIATFVTKVSELERLHYIWPEEHGHEITLAMKREVRTNQNQNIELIHPLFSMFRPKIVLYHISHIFLD